VAEQQGGTKVVFIKKKNRGHGHHGGAWKVAYADFVTAMMALFIVLWLLTQSDQASKEVIAEYFRTGTMPGGSLTLGRPSGSNPPVPVDILPQGSKGGRLSKRAVQKIQGAIEKMLKKSAKDPALAKIAKNVSIKISERGALIELVDNDEDLLFAVASSELKPAVVRFLSELAPSLDETGAEIEIHGHTDARGYKDSKKTNWDLSFERADTAREVLEEGGVKHGRIVGVLAHADTQPYVVDDPLAPQNRRLSILVTHGSLPGMDDEAKPEEGAPPEQDAAAEEGDGKGAPILAPGSLKREAERQKRELERQQRQEKREQHSKETPK
jgi:chemotaxis protein MotB